MNNNVDKTLLLTNAAVLATLLDPATKNVLQGMSHASLIQISNSRSHLFLNSIMIIHIRQVKGTTTRE